MSFRIVTNNPLVNEKYSLSAHRNNLSELVFLEGSTFIEVLEHVRDLVHAGHKLLTHPLTGSIKPYETPYKSIAVSEEKGQLDFDSLNIIEGSIETTKKFIADHRPREYAPRHHNDFMIIDRHLIDSGVESINQFR